MDKPLVRLIKAKRKKNHINKITNEKNGMKLTEAEDVKKR